MSVFRQSGKPNVTLNFLKKASQALDANSVVSIDANGYIIPATAVTTNYKGIVLQKVASTDSDYATARAVPIDVVKPGELFEMACNTTITQTMVGMLYDLADANVVDNSDDSGAIDVIEIVGIVKATYVDAANPSIALVRFNPVAEFSTTAA